MGGIDREHLEAWRDGAPKISGVSRTLAAVRNYRSTRRHFSLLRVFDIRETSRVYRQLSEPPVGTSRIQAPNEMNSPSDFGCRGNQEQVGYCGTSAYAWHLY